MKHGIYWLASYPKSGNTWMRAIISNYLVNAEEAVKINDFQTDGIASSRSFFNENLCIPSEDLNLEEIQAYQPDMYREFVKDSKKDLYIKVHDAYILNKLKEPLFPKDVTKGVLYIVRNPLDVVVSYAHHNSSEVSKSIKNINDNNFIVSKPKKTLPSQLPQVMLSWSNHVESWMNSPLPICIIRYEDMLEKPFETFSKALSFLGFEIEKERLEKAIKFSSFKELKKQEEKDSFNEKPINSKSFFRNGKINSYLDSLEKRMIKEIKEKHKKTMKKFKYIS